MMYAETAVRVVGILKCMEGSVPSTATVVLGGWSQFLRGTERGVSSLFPTPEGRSIFDGFLLERQ